MKAAFRRKAFSLVELIVVLAIVGIISAVAIPRFAGAATRQRARAAARRVEADLNRLRSHAFQTSTKQGVVFDTTTHAYAMAGMSDPDLPGKYYVVSLADEPYLATIVEANFSGSPKFEYDGYGKPSVGGKVLVSAGGEQATVIVKTDTGEAYVE